MMDRLLHFQLPQVLPERWVDTYEFQMWGRMGAGRWGQEYASLRQRKTSIRISHGGGMYEVQSIVIEVIYRLLTRGTTPDVLWPPF